ncbi:hypothetical protein GGF49_004582 [Coemansia sp. RSA 1853]|nr:hypothetical protein GGF49_004582 [Coemansia sp. RSA 1853]
MTAASKNESDADSSADAIVTACGYLTAQADLEREAAEVLSGKFDECTFDQGYVHQPLTESGEMIQCFVCNDWFHDACIGKVPEEESYSDYICRECVGKHAILRYINTNMICGTVVDGKVTHIEANSAIYDTSTYLDPVEKDDTEEPAKKKTRATGCRQRQDSDVVDAKQPFDLFMVDGWKEHVCTCIDCMREIECSNLEFLIKEEDVVEPEEDESRSESLYESALRQLQTMDRAQAVDAAAAYHTLSSRLKDYLRPFAASGKVVTNQDIHTFFEQHDKNNL